MARKRVENNNKKQWGVNRPVRVTRVRPDGTTYHEWRVAYRVTVEDETGTKSVRRYACSSDSPEAAVLLAAERTSDGGFKAGVKAERSKTRTRAQAAPPKASKTLREIAEEMMELSRRWREGKLIDLSHSYIRRVENYVRHLDSSGLASKTLDQLNGLDIKRWFIGYATTHADTTSRNYRAWLLKVGDYAVDHDYWSKNLFRLITPVTLDSTKELRVLTLDEIDALWNAAATPQEKAALVLLRIGLRQGEILGLTEKAILDDNTIQIDYTLTERKDPTWEEGCGYSRSHQFLGRPKTVRSRGKIHVPSPWMAILRESLSQAHKVFVNAYDDPNCFPSTHRFVVCNPRGGLWQEWSASRAMRKLIERSGVEIGPNEATWHCWRHAYSADLVMLKADDLSLAANLRHSDPNLSKTAYGHARDQFRDLYAPFVETIKSLKDFNEAICAFDESRRAAKR